MLVSSGLSGKLETLIETSVKLKKDEDCNKLTIVSCIGLIVKSLFFFCKQSETCSLRGYRGVPRRRFGENT